MTPIAATGNPEDRCGGKGGASFTVGGGAPSYACNGGGGGDGPPTLNTGQGIVRIAGCSDGDADANVTVTLLHHFDNSDNRRDFFLDGIVLKDLPRNCAKIDNQMVLTFFIQTGQLLNQDSNARLEYDSGKSVICIHDFSADDVYPSSPGSKMNLKLINDDNERFTRIAFDPTSEMRIDFTCYKGNSDGDPELLNGELIPQVVQKANKLSVIGTRDIYGSIAFEFSDQKRFTRDNG
jgi:hypothetical protein